MFKLKVIAFAAAATLAASPGHAQTLDLPDLSQVLPMEQPAGNAIEALVTAKISPRCILRIGDSTDGRALLDFGDITEKHGWVINTSLTGVDSPWISCTRGEGVRFALASPGYMTTTPLVDARGLPKEQRIRFEAKVEGVTDGFVPFADGEQVTAFDNVGFSGAVTRQIPITLRAWGGLSPYGTYNYESGDYVGVMFLSVGVR